MVCSNGVYDPVDCGAALEDEGGDGVVVGRYKVNNEVHGDRVFTDHFLNELDNSLVKVRLDCEVFDTADVVRGVRGEGDDVEGGVFIGYEPLSEDFV